MNAEEVAETTAALRRLLVLVQTGEMSEAAGCRVEGAVAALASISGDPSSPFARSQIENSSRRLTAIRGEGGMTESTAHRTEGALIALQSLAGDAASLLARLGPRPRLSPPGPRMPSTLDDHQPAEVWLTHRGQPQTTQVQF